MKEARRLFLDMKRLRKRFKYFVIGEITRKREGMYLVGKEGRISKLKMEGYRHL